MLKQSLYFVLIFQKSVVVMFVSQRQFILSEHDAGCVILIKPEKDVEAETVKHDQNSLSSDTCQYMDSSSHSLEPYQHQDSNSFTPEGYQHNPEGYQHLDSNSHSNKCRQHQDSNNMLPDVVENTEENVRF